jgi:methylthioribose-1-phosphate isomerase
MELDAYLPSLLKKSHIARIEHDQLLIGDRRSLPWKQEMVPCTTIDEVAEAIRSMVTQGGGPLQVALTFMRLLGQRIYLGKETNSLSVFLNAADKLERARPTNTTMARTIRSVVAEVGRWYTCNGIRDMYDHDFPTFVDEIVDRYEQQFDRDYDAMSEIGEGLLQQGEGILTTCFAEHSFMLTLAKAKARGKQVVVYVPETRPYLQGARLTAPALQELGIPSYLITDGMGAHLMQDGTIQRYLTAADTVAMDGTVVNKVGTLANAICCAHYHIPYHAFSLSPDASLSSGSDIVMEMRDGRELLQCGSQKITLESIGAYYPAFDRVDADLVTSIITPSGNYSPQEIASVYAEHTHA